MLFNSMDFLYFFLFFFLAYWLLSRKMQWQNLLLLIASYVFYGYVHPWFCGLLAISTCVDFFCGLGILRHPKWKKQILWTSVAVNLGILATFKYNNFFIDNFTFILQNLGIHLSTTSLDILLPVGISFYTFQSVSYTIDIYRQKLKPCTNGLEFAIYIAFFPQLVAGPIERASRLLPQIQQSRVLSWQKLRKGAFFIIQGLLMKVVIADRLAPLVDKIYMLQHPSFILLCAGTFAFAFQIYMDFHGYTSMARGIAQLLGFDLVRNFNSPYLAHNPSEFWKRWHISLSQWVRDYIYIPLGGSHFTSSYKILFSLTATMALMGLWHGAAWNFVAWGVYHGLLSFVYLLAERTFALSWQRAKPLLIAIMFAHSLFGWMIFRCPDLTWLWQALGDGFSWGSQSEWLFSIYIVCITCLYLLPLLAIALYERFYQNKRHLGSMIHGFMLFMILMFAAKTHEFIYFQF